MNLILVLFLPDGIQYEQKQKEATVFWSTRAKEKKTMLFGDSSSPILMILFIFREAFSQIVAEPVFQEF